MSDQLRQQEVGPTARERTPVVEQIADLARERYVQAIAGGIWAVNAGYNFFAEKHNLIVASDAAYSEIAFDGYRPSSFLKAESGKETGVEFHSLSKTCNMTGWRVGFACGNEKIISGIAKVKSNIDSGVFNAIQMAGVTALDITDKHLEKMNKIYQERRDILVDGLNRLGWAIKKPKATFYVWAKLPKGNKSSIEFAGSVLDKANIIITPGICFGENGEGYVRFALTVSRERIQEAVERMKKII